MALQMHRAARTDLLAEGLAAVLATPLANPFEADVVVVPARGIERWLTQRLSHRLGAATNADDGVCAGVRFLTPNSLVTLLLGRDRDDPWLPDHLVWPLLATIDASLDEPWATQLAAHLGHGDDSPRGRQRAGRRYSVAHRLARLLHSYAVQRPSLLSSWEEGRTDGPWTDGLGGPLDPALAWQAHLWRAVVDRIGGTTPARRHTDTVARLIAGDDALDLPERLSMFGHTRLARTEIELLGALGRRREVHLWLPHPSPVLWDRLAATVADGPVPRSDDDSVVLVHNPLLASLGRDLRELQRGLATTAAVEHQPLVDPRPPTASWLHRLQAGLRGDRVPGQSDRIEPDASIQVHACHGPARQVEVLREVLLGLLQDDQSLEPRDILVMCPDIETFAPLVQAAFGLADIRFDGAAHPAHQLRVQLADRGPLTTNPLVGVAARLVQLSAGRVTASEVLDLAASDPVRRRFAFGDDDLDQLSRWVDEAGVRWGLDAPHRGAFDLGAIEANTWRAGVDRLLLGVAREEAPGHWTGRVLPIDDVDSGNIDLAGRIAEFLDRIDAIRGALLAAVSAEEWMDRLADGVDAVADVPLEDVALRAELDRELAAVSRAAEGGIPLRLADVRVLLEQRLGSRPTRSNFRTGGLTVCTLVPMRSVPHRVVALLGIDDGTFPRGNAIDGDDVLARRPVTGERDVRSEDRQLLLDAIGSATDTLVITYSGADPNTGAPRPPAVPLGELIDAARAELAEPSDPAPVRHHPLQPFDDRNLDPNSPFSFDAAALSAAEAARCSPLPARRGLPLSEPLDARPSTDISLEQLSSFFANPARAFLRSRLDVGVPLEDEPALDAIPIELDSLQEWAIGDRLLAGVLSGASIDDIQRAEHLRGRIPPRYLGAALLGRIGPVVDAISGRAFTVLPRPGGDSAPAALDIEVDLGGGRLLHGTVPTVVDRATVLTTYSKPGPRHRLDAWLRLLALTAGTPSGQGPWVSHLVGRAGQDGAMHERYGPLDPEQAREVLRELIAVYDRGMREPIPFLPKTTHAYATVMIRSTRKSEANALNRARREWLGEAFPGERADPWVRRVHGADPAFDILTGPPDASELWSGAVGPYADQLATRLGHYAMRVWSGFFAAKDPR